MRLSISEVEQASTAGAVLVDIRKSTSFGAAFIAGSINIGLTPSSSNWLQMVVEQDQEIVLVSDYDAEATAATTQFGAVGFRNIRGFLDGGVHAWAAAGKELDHLPQLTVHGLRHVLDKYPDHVLLDVRTDEEWATGHLDRARHLAVGPLVHVGGLEDLTHDRHITTMCGSGYRSNIAGSYLKSRGYQHVYSVLGGVTGWRAAFNL